MRVFLIVLSIVCFSNIDLIAQNVGIGTANPQAKLHAKCDQGMVSAFYEGFNEGLINPAHQIGNTDCTVITDDPRIGTYGVGAPRDFLNNETAILEFAVNTPVGRDVRISFSASHNGPRGYIGCYVVKPGGSCYVDHSPGWKNYTTNFIATASESIIRFVVESVRTIVSSN